MVKSMLQFADELNGLNDLPKKNKGPVKNCTVNLNFFNFNP